MEQCREEMDNSCEENTRRHQEDKPKATLQLSTTHDARVILLSSRLSGESSLLSGSYATLLKRTTMVMVANGPPPVLFLCFSDLSESVISASILKHAVNH